MLCFIFAILPITILYIITVQITTFKVFYPVQFNGQLTLNSRFLVLK